MTRKASPLDSRPGSQTAERRTSSENAYAVCGLCRVQCARFTQQGRIIYEVTSQVKPTLPSTTVAKGLIPGYNGPSWADSMTEKAPDDPFDVLGVELDADYYMIFNAYKYIANAWSMDQYCHWGPCRGERLDTLSDRGLYVHLKAELAFLALTNGGTDAPDGSDTEDLSREVETQPKVSGSGAINIDKCCGVQYFEGHFCAEDLTCEIHLLEMKLAVQ